MIINQKHKYSPKKREELNEYQKHQMTLTPTVARQNSDIVVPTKVEKSNNQDKKILNKKNNNDLDFFFDFGFGIDADFLKSFYNGDNIVKLSKDNDINHEK